MFDRLIPLATVGGLALTITNTDLYGVYIFSDDILSRITVQYNQNVENCLPAITCHRVDLQSSVRCAKPLTITNYYYYYYYYY